MEKVRWYQDKVLALGRAGELVTSTDPQTYKLLTRIFGPKGPYRSVLKSFGLGRDNTSIDYLVYLNGKVYSDISKENQVLWHTCMSELRLKDKDVVLESALCERLLGCGLAGYIKKTTFDSMIISFPGKYLKLCAEHYKEYSQIFKNTLEKETISEKEFLDAYKNVVYVTYIYELFFTYNHTLEVHSSNKQCHQEYIRDNDYLLKFDPSFFEISCRDGMGFNVKSSKAFLAKLKKSKSRTLKLIPESFPELKCGDNMTLNAESVLQCYKNNMRLKTEALIKLIDEYREM